MLRAQRRERPARVRARRQGGRLRRLRQTQARRLLHSDVSQTKCAYLNWTKVFLKFRNIRNQTSEKTMTSSFTFCGLFLNDFLIDRNVQLIVRNRVTRALTF